MKNPFKNLWCQTPPEKLKVIMPTRAEAEQYFADVIKFGPDPENILPYYIKNTNTNTEYFSTYLHVKDSNSCTARLVEFPLSDIVTRCKTVDDFVEMIRERIMLCGHLPVDVDEGAE